MSLKQSLIPKTCYQCSVELSGKAKRADRPNATWEEVTYAYKGMKGRSIYMERPVCNACVVADFKSVSHNRQ